MSSKQTAVNSAKKKCHKRPRKMLTFKQKKEICQYRLDNPKMKQIKLHEYFTTKFKQKIGRTTMFDILSNSDRWLNISERECDRVKPSNAFYKELEDELYEWYLTAKASDQRVKDIVIIAKAQELGVSHNVHPNFNYSSGWLRGFKERHQLLTPRPKLPIYMSNSEDETEEEEVEIEPESIAARAARDLKTVEQGVRKLYASASLSSRGGTPDTTELTKAKTSKQHLSQHSHMKRLIEKFWEWMNAGLCCDLVLKTGEETIPCHKLVLAASSSYLYDILFNKELQYAVDSISCPNMTHTTLLDVVTYIYTGYEDIVKAENVDEILCIAETWHITDLIEICQMYKERLPPLSDTRSDEMSKDTTSQNIVTADDGSKPEITKSNFGFETSENVAEDSNEKASNQEENVVSFTIKREPIENDNFSQLETTSFDGDEQNVKDEMNNSLDDVQDDSDNYKEADDHDDDDYCPESPKKKKVPTATLR